MRKNRGRGEGSISQREDGLWEGKISLGYHHADGKRKRHRPTVYGKTKKEVQDKLRELQNKAATGTLQSLEKVSLGDYLNERWLPGLKATEQTCPTTLARYEDMVKFHIVPRLGGVLLSKLAPIHLESFYNEMQANGVSPRVRNMAATVLGTALRHAVRLQLLSNNPSIHVPKPRYRRSEMKTYAADEVRRLLDAAKDLGGIAYPLLSLAVGTGMRQGELFGLQWQDVDLERGCLTVRRSLEELKGTMRLKDTKSAAGQRRVDLPASVVAAVAEHRKAMLAAGRYAPEAIVFCDRNGGFLRKSNVVRRIFFKAIEKANEKAKEAAEKAKLERHDFMPRLRFHDLRHTHATLLLLAGVNGKVVQERLGHASIELTLNTYSHVTPTMQEAAVEKLEKLLA